MQRYSVDEDTATIVSRRARILFTATRMSWQLDGNDWELVHRVARTHEIGMAISHKHFNRHSAYLLRNADLPGFSLQEQEELALLALAHRGKLDQQHLSDIPEVEQPRVLRLIAITRLAALFKYVEQLEQLPDFTINAGENFLALDFPENWLEQHPLTASELTGEITALGKVGIVLTVS
jgi:exopolyphosphatase/guanosine-5'-triphosphate,3'-diphosphate pyrophosphatase